MPARRKAAKRKTKKTVENASLLPPTEVNACSVLNEG